MPPVTQALLVTNVLLFLAQGWGIVSLEEFALWPPAGGPLGSRFELWQLVTYSFLHANLAHIFFNLGSSVPTVGASGAISGVLGGYLVMFPRNRVRVMSYQGVVGVPAFMVLGLWIVIQFLNGFGSVATTDETAGVAYLAHIGGFIAGVVLVKVFGVGVRRAAFA